MENNLDKLFKSKLRGQEPEFHPAAWERMEGLLDASGMTPTQEDKPKRSRRFFWIFFLVGLLFSSVGYYTSQSDTMSDKGSTLVESSLTESKSTLQNSINKNSTNNNKVTQTTSGNNLTSSDNENKTPTNTLNEISKPSTAQTTENSTLTKKDVFNNRKERNSSTITFKKDGSNPSVIDDEMEYEMIERSLEEPTQKDNTPLDISTLNNTSTNTGLVVHNENEEAALDLNDSNNSEVKDLKVINEMLPQMDWLETKTGAINSKSGLIIPQINVAKPSLFELGIQASFRPGSATGYSVGPYLAYGVGKGISVQIGGQFDSQSFENGPNLSIYDKIYSFGSELRERNFVLSNQKSVRIPLTVQKRFSNFSLSSGVILNQVMQSNGAMDLQDGGSEIISADHELIRTRTIAYHFGASVGLNRYFELDFGAEYRPRTLINDAATSNNGSTFYPSVGLRYKLFKF